MPQKFLYTCHREGRIACHKPFTCFGEVSQTHGITTKLADVIGPEALMWISVRTLYVIYRLGNVDSIMSCLMVIPLESGPINLLDAVRP